MYGVVGVGEQASDGGSGSWRGRDSRYVDVCGWR